MGDGHGGRLGSWREKSIVFWLGLDIGKGRGYGHRRRVLGWSGRVVEVT